MQFGGWPADLSAERATGQGQAAFRGMARRGRKEKGPGLQPGPEGCSAGLCRKGSGRGFMAPDQLPGA